MIQELGGIEEAEMYRTFNMGIGMVVVVDRDVAPSMVEALNAAGERAGIIGEIARGGHDVHMV